VDSVSVEAGAGLSAAVKGPHWERNQQWRRERKVRKQRKRGLSVAGPSGEGSPISASRREAVADSNAQRLIDSNLLAAEKSRLALAKLRSDAAAGVFERRTQVESKFLEGQLAGTYSLAPPSRVKGWAATLPSGAASSATVPSTGVSSAKVSKATAPSSVELEEHERVVEEFKRKEAELVARLKVVEARSCGAEEQNRRYERQLGIETLPSGLKHVRNEKVPWHVDGANPRAHLRGSGPFGQISRLEEIELDKKEAEAERLKQKALLKERMKSDDFGYSKWDV